MVSSANLSSGFAGLRGPRESVDIMVDTPHHPEVADLVRSLRQLEDSLAAHEEIFGRAKLSRVRQVAETSDGACIDMVPGFFGGMGSFNDLGLNALNSANTEFASARRRSYDRAQALTSR